MVWVIAINQKPITQNYQNDVKISISSENCPKIAKIIIFLLIPPKSKINTIKYLCNCSNHFNTFSDYLQCK